MIAVDIGNSQLHCAFRRLGSNALDPASPEPILEASVDWQGLAGDPAASERLWQALNRSPLGPHLQTSPAPPESWWIASVNPPATAVLQQAVAQYRPRDLWHEIRSVDVPLGDRLQNRAATGVDRLLVAWYASRYLAPAPTGTLVVDAGSAVTVDWVDAAGDFRGGMIYPGFALSGRALQRGTAALPPVTAIDLQAPLPSPAGTATQEAIAAGLFWSQWGGLCCAIEALQKFACRATQAENSAAADPDRPAADRSAGPVAGPVAGPIPGPRLDAWLEPPQVVLTGGGIAAFQSLLPSEWRWEPDLLLRAIFQVADLRSSAAGPTTPAAAAPAFKPTCAGEERP